MPRNPNTQCYVVCEECWDCVASSISWLLPVPEMEAPQKLATYHYSQHDPAERLTFTNAFTGSICLSRRADQDWHVDVSSRCRQGFVSSADW